MAGPMDEYGYLKSLDPAKRDAIQITAENNTYACAHVYNHIVVENTTWTVKEPMIFHNGATVTVKDGATLVVNNGAVLKDIRLVLEKGAHVIVDGQSVLKMLNAGEFSVPVGATLDLNNGIIK